MTMSSYWIHTFLFIFIIVICDLSSVSASLDCASCCTLSINCNTAYNGGPGHCCYNGITPYCCSTSASCIGNGVCRTDYLGLTLVGLIGVIAASIVGFILLISFCVCVCRRQQPVIITQPAYIAPAYTAPVYYNPGAQQIHTNAPAGVSYKAQY